MKHRAIVVLGVALGSFTGYVACVGDAPTPTGQPDSGTPSDSGNVSDAGPPDVAPIGCPSGCLPAAPSGWIGPSAVFDGTTAAKPAACPTSTYTQKELDGVQGLTGDPAACACGAPTFQGSSCTSVAVDYSSDGTCSSPQLNLGTFAGGDCKGPSSNPTGYVKLQAPTVADAGTCAFPNPTKTVPAPSFATENLSCGNPSPAACPANAKCTLTPVPAAPFNRVCIHQDGDNPCPPVAEYAKRFVTYRNVDDTRGCSACTGTASAAGCTMVWTTLGNTLQCQAISSYPNTAGSTCLGAANAKVIATSATLTNPTCTAAGGKPTGAATLANPVTFCCNN